MNVQKLGQLNRKITVAMLTMIMVTACPAVSFAANDEGIDRGDVTSSVDLSDMSEETAVADELLVIVRDDTNKRELNSITKDAGASLEDINSLNDGTKMARIDLDGSEDVQKVAEEMVSDEQVLTVQPNYMYAVGEDENELSASSDPSIMVDTKVIREKMIDQWYLDSVHPGAVKAFEGWERLYETDDPITVAVIDTGVKLDHPDLKDNIIRDKCVSFNYGKKGSFTQWDGSEDDTGHGTHVAGIIASNANDGFGISGVADDRARLMVIDAALKTNKKFTTQDVVLGIDYAVTNGADIINMSISGLQRDYIVEDAIARAFASNVLCICAAGNDNSDLPATPSDAPGAVSVMAHDEQGTKTTSSNYGEEKDVSAPGANIISSFINNNERYADYAAYSIGSGTSMAAPVVTGLAALIKSEDATISARQLKNLIYTSSDNWDFSSYGFGRINIVNAVNNVHSSSEPQKVVLNRSNKTMYIGEDFTLEYAIYPGSASVYADDVTFVSSNPAVARVDGMGCVKAIKVGSATITVKCQGRNAACKVKVKSKQVANTMTLKAKTVTVKYSKLKKKNQTIARAKLISVKKARGRVTYSKISGNSKIKVNRSTGKFTIKKKLKKGKYKVRVRVTAAGNSKYRSEKKYTTVIIKVK